MEPAQAERIDWQTLASFTPRQREAMEAMYTHRFILYGGARGGGKSRWLRWGPVEYLIGLAVEEGIRGVRGGLFCETYPDLRDRHITKISTEFPSWLGDLRESKEHGLAFHISDSYGGGILTLRNLDDPAKYQSSEFAIIAVDELTQTQRSTFDILRGSLRWPGLSHTVFCAGTNPGGAGHLWVKQLWIDRDFPPELRSLANQFAFVQSLPADNPHLDQTYWDDLNTLPDDLRRAWVYGDWSVFAGQAFTAWRDHVHVIEPFSIPDYWPRWRAVDWGYAVPFGCLWLARNPDNGRHYLYREAYAANLTDRQQARLVSDLTPPGETIQTTYADPSMFARKRVGDVIHCTADEYRNNGVLLTAGDNDRLSGKRKVDRLLMSLPDGGPGLQVFRTCVNFIRTFPALAYDRARVEDVDTNQDDHLYDCLRYALTAVKTQPTRPQAQKQSGLLQGKYL